MSPLVVSQVLPARQLFDLVIFDEASQIEPPDAIPAIMRGNSVVVAGDNKQLPPTPFFATLGGDDDEVEAEGAVNVQVVSHVMARRRGGLCRGGSRLA